MICVTRQAIDQQAAAVTKASGPPGVPQFDQQGSLTPVPLSPLHQRGTGDVAHGALSESIASAPVVEHLDMASASGAANLAQLGAARPSGDPGSREEFHTAPTGTGARFRENGPRIHGANLWLPGPKGTI